MKRRMPSPLWKFTPRVRLCPDVTRISDTFHESPCTPAHSPRIFPGNMRSPRNMRSPPGHQSALRDCLPITAATRHSQGAGWLAAKVGAGLAFLCFL